jgi:phosphatidate cytidylyltransferase
MSPEVWQRFVDYHHAFDQPVTAWISLTIIGLMILSGGVAWLLRKFALIGAATYGDVIGRWKSWSWLSICMMLPILLGAGYTIAAVTLLSLGCYREFARATGVFRFHLISLAAVAGILVVNFAVFDHYDRLFFATAPLTVALIAVVTIPQDRPQGYTQRVALGTIGFLLFGFSFAYIGNIANAANYRPVLLLMILAVSLNDIFAYCTGRLLGKRKLLPQTSPNKTLAGSLGALCLTTLVVVIIGHFVFAETATGAWHWLLILGLLISSLGQLGDLVLSSIKRDVGVKDLGTLIPGHGGLLDRFDSLVLVPPVVYHFLSLIQGPLGFTEPAQIFTGN